MSEDRNITDRDRPYKVGYHARTSDEHSGESFMSSLFGGTDVGSAVAGLAGETIVSDAFAVTARNMIHNNVPEMLKHLGEERANKITQNLALMSTLAIAFYSEGKGVYKTFKDGKKQLSQMNERARPYLKAEGLHADLRSIFSKSLRKNEVLKAASDRIYDQVSSSVKGEILAKFLVSVPLLWKCHFKDEMPKASNLDMETLKDKLHDMRPMDLNYTNYKKAKNNISLIQDIFQEGQVSVPGLAVLGGGWISKNLEGRFRKEKYAAMDRVVALDLITYLYNYLDRHNPKAKEIDLSEFIKLHKKHKFIGFEDKGRVPIEDFIKEIVYTHVDSVSDSGIGGRDEDKLDYAVKQIVEALHQGKLHPLALIKVVGERGPDKLIDEDFRVADRDTVEKILGEAEDLLPQHWSVDAREYIADSYLGKGDVAELLGKLPGEYRDHYIHMIPEEVAVRYGELSETDIEHSRTRAEENFIPTLEQMVLDIDSFPDEQIVEVLHLNDKEHKKVPEMIHELAEKIKNGDERAVKDSLATHGDFKDIRFYLLQWTDYSDELAKGAIKPGMIYEKAKEAKKLEQAKESEIELPEGEGEKHASEHIKQHTKEKHDHEDEEEKSEPSSKETKGHHHQGVISHHKESELRV